MSIAVKDDRNTVKSGGSVGLFTVAFCQQQEVVRRKMAVGCKQLVEPKAFDPVEIHTVHNGNDAVSPNFWVDIVVAQLTCSPADVAALSGDFARDIAGMQSVRDAVEGCGKLGDDRIGGTLRIGITLFQSEVEL